jgi:hypothetical protein
MIRYVPAVVGIPERAPEELRANPLGRAEIVVKEQETVPVDIVCVSGTPAIPDFVSLEVNAGGVEGGTTLTDKIPMAVFPVSELAALNPREKVPLISEPGVSLMMPLFSSIEAQVGFEVSVYASAPLLLRI